MMSPLHFEVHSMPDHVMKETAPGFDKGLLQDLIIVNWRPCMSYMTCVINVFLTSKPTCFVIVKTQ